MASVDPWVLGISLVFLLIVFYRYVVTSLRQGEEITPVHTFCHRFGLLAFVFSSAHVYSPLMAIDC